MSDQEKAKVAFFAAAVCALATICFTIVGAASSIVDALNEQTYRQAVDTNIIEGALTQRCKRGGE